MKVTKLPALGILFILFSGSCLGQSNEQKTARVMSIIEKQALIKRAKTYESTIHIADSLLLENTLTKFYIETKKEHEVQDGLTFIYNLYLNAKEMTSHDTYCDSKIQSLSKQIDEESLKEQDRQYQKIIDKAEEYFSTGNFDKAIELYERAVQFRPSDIKASNRLKDLKEKKAK